VKPADTPFGHPLTYPGDQWTCPVTGWVIAKDRSANVLQRQRLLTLADQSEVWRARWLHACAASSLVWINTCAWTYVLVEQTDTGRRQSQASPHQPFVTWPVQDAAINTLHQCEKEGKSIVWDKSREMGATWVCLADCLHQCLFRAGANILVASRKEDLVDRPNDPDSLFWKLDYMLDRLPWWMRPTVDRARLRMRFTDRDTGIDGDSTGDDIGRGGRRTRIVIDEAAAIDNLRSIDAATQDSTPCRIFISTPKRGSYFGLLKRSGKLPIVRMAWWDHPEKGRGRKLVQDEETGEWYFTTPWYEAEVAKRVDAQDIAENLDIDDEGSSSVVFDPKTLHMQRALYVRPPTFRGTVALPRGEIVDPSQEFWSRPLHKIGFVPAEAGSTGRLWWWGDLREDADGILRPPPFPCGIGVDVAQGVGASDSVITFENAETGEQVGRWRHNLTMPNELGQFLYLLGFWLARGNPERTPTIAIEANGPGAAVILTLRRLEYPTLYRMPKDETKVRREKPNYGWTSTRHNKRSMLEVFRGALARREVQSHDAEMLDQCAAYTNYEEGGVGPLTLSGMSEEQRAQHGDMVISAMLAHEACLRMPASPEGKHEAPPGSFGWRRKRREERRRRQSDADEDELD